MMSIRDAQDPEAVLADVAVQLESIVAGLCRQLDPFPAFLGMTTIQAVELEPTPLPNQDLGCVVVIPDGTLAELDVAAIPGIVGVLEVDQVEEFKPLNLAAGEYVIYLTEAIRALAAELARRSG